MAVNGSNELGRCSPTNVHSAVDGDGEDDGVACTDPESSVLFDGVIPTLTFDSDMWANQLLTISERYQYFDEGVSLFFPSALDITPKVGRVEVVIFNCPEWGISVESIAISVNYGERHMTFPNTTSCRSLVRLCIDTELSNLSIIHIGLNLKSNSNWVHIAEVLVHSDNNSFCDHEIPVTTSSPSTILAASLTSVLLVLIAAVALVAIILVILCKLRANRRQALNSAAMTERESVYDEVGVCHGGRCA